MLSTCCREPSCSGSPSDCRTRRLVLGWGLQASDLRDLLRISRSWTEGRECGLAKVGRGQSQLRWVESTLATIIPSSLSLLQDITSSLRLHSGVEATTILQFHFQYSTIQASNKMKFMEGESEVAIVTLKMTRKSCGK